MSFRDGVENGRYGASEWYGELGEIDFYRYIARRFVIVSEVVSLTECVVALSWSVNCS